MKRFLLIILILCCNLSAQNDSWKINGEMLIPVAGGEAVLLNDKIFILGGFSDSLQAPVNFIQMYDPVSGEWSVVGEMLEPRMDFVADNYNDGILFFGSINSESDFASSNPMEFWQFNTDSGQLTYSNSFRNNDNFARSASTGLIHNDHFYIFGGQLDESVGESQNVYSVIQYDIPNSTVLTSFNPENQAVQFPTHQMSAIIGDEIYIFGGVFNGISNSIYKFDINNGNYELLPLTLLKTRADGATISFEDDSIILIGGFNESSTAMREVERFYPASIFGFESVSDLPRLNIARVNCMAVNIDDKVYVFGGFDSNGFVVKEIETIQIDSFVTDIDDFNSISDKIRLDQNYPNPFNPTTKIRFTLNEATHVSLKIYSVMGEEIKTITSQTLNTGYHEYLWDGSDKNGNQVTSGVYIYRLSGANYSQQKKMLLLR